ncbi:MAG TPA: hypothetical protein VNK89_08770 [Thermoflexus sp.]|nr:hypothetical protein [Thermoflexus sp.]
MSNGQLTNRYARQILAAAREVIGLEAWGQALQEAGLGRYQETLPPLNSEPGIRFGEISAFCQRIRERFGPEGGSVLRRIGHEVFQRDLQAYGWVAHLIRVVTSILQAPQERVRNALQRAVNVVRLETGSAPHIWQEGARFYWENPSCPYCVGVTCAEPCCDLPAGVLEALVAWTLERSVDTVRVVEETCRGNGESACRYRIEW